MAQATVSQHLKELKKLGVIQGSIEGTSTCYCINNEKWDLISGSFSQFFAQKNDLAGKRALITAGPTYEDIDPVRFIGNRSSGKMGVALAAELAERGAQVKLILGPSHQKIEHPLVETILKSQKIILSNYAQKNDKSNFLINIVKRFKDKVNYLYNVFIYLKKKYNSNYD